MLGKLCMTMHFTYIGLGSCGYYLTTSLVYGFKNGKLEKPVMFCWGFAFLEVGVLCTILLYKLHKRGQESIDSLD